MLKLSVDVVDFDGPGASSSVSWPPPLTCASLMPSSAMCNVQSTHIWIYDYSLSKSSWQSNCQGKVQTCDPWSAPVDVTRAVCYARVTADGGHPTL